jgi:hypothetical protein
MSYLLDLVQPAFLLRPTGQRPMAMLIAGLLALGVVGPVGSSARVAWADEEESRSEDEDSNDEESEDEDSDEEDGDEVNESSDDESNESAMEEVSHEGETDDSLVGRLERVKQLIAEGKSDEAQSLLDSAIEQARGMVHHEEYHGDGEMALDVEQLRTLVTETRDQMLKTLEGARVVGEATNAVESAGDTLTSALDELRPSTAIQTAIKEARAKAREIFRDARKNSDAARVLQRNNVVARFDELLANAAGWRGVEESLDEMKNQVAERLREGDWQNELDEAVMQAIGRVQDSLPDDAAEQWNDDRFQQANQIGDILEIARRSKEHLASVFERDFVAEAMEAVNRTREGAEAALNEHDLGAAWEEALSQAAAEHPEIEALRNNEHAARLRTVLSDLKTAVMQALSVDSMESLLRARLGDATAAIHKSFEPANIEAKWQEITSGYEMRIEQLRADSEQKRIAAEEAARRAEEEAEVAEAARQLAEEQAAEANEARQEEEGQ